MATFNFNEANGTTIEAIDSLWAGDTSALEVQAGCIQPTTAFGDVYALYVNGQPSNQSSRALFKAGPNAGHVRELKINSTSITTGYACTPRGAFDGVNIVKNNVYLTTITGTIPDWTANDIEIWLTSVAGLLSVHVNGVLLGTYDDTASPVTGGNPGIRLYGAGAAAESRADWWSDGVIAGDTYSRRAIITRSRAA